MQETRAIGYEEPRGYFALTHEIDPTYVLIQLGSDDPWRWPGEGRPRPGWKTIGMVTFNRQGAQKDAVIEHGAVNQLQTELQVWRDKESAGWPMPSNPDDYVMSIFVGKYIATFTDVGVVETRRKYPQHLPLPNGAAVLCCTELRPFTEHDEVPGEWLAMLGVNVHDVYADVIHAQMAQGAE